MKVHRLVALAGTALFAGLAGASEIQGVVRGPGGPEAGVWVIAETAGLPTRFARIVVTDDKGRFLVPELPMAQYEVWVRGYGLLDSPRVTAAPGARLALAAVPAPSEEDAAAGERRYLARSEEMEKLAPPFAARGRPSGVARNLVVTVWEWGRLKQALHELAASDRRNPLLHAYGRLYGSPEATNDLVPILDPKTHSSSAIVHPVRDPQLPSPSASPMLDEKGHVWFASRIAPTPNPQYCARHSKHPSAQAFPLEGESDRHLAMYDPKRGDWKLLRTCFPTHQLAFGLDEDNTLWTSSGTGGVQVLGWVNRRVFEQSGDAARAQGWTPFVLDTNGDGRRGAYVEPETPLDPKKDKRIAVNLYSVAVSPLDGAVWGSVAGSPGGIVRVVPGSDPVRTALAEYYEVPAPGYGPRGGDVDTNGVYWVSLASGHLGRFVRANCKVTSGPRATGRHCREGWTFYPLPGLEPGEPKAAGSAQASPAIWVDWYGILGLGRNVPIALAGGVEAMHALIKGNFVTLFVPHPLDVTPKSIDGRIDSEAAGWKGRGLWTTSGSGGAGDARPTVVKLQLRPNPLAR